MRQDRIKSSLYDFGFLVGDIIMRISMHASHNVYRGRFAFLSHLPFLDDPGFFSIFYPIDTLDTQYSSKVV